MHHILLTWVTLGIPERKGFALVPSTLLEDLPLDDFDGILMDEESSDWVRDIIVCLYARLGLRACGEVKADLAGYVNRPMLSIPDRVVPFGWIV